MRPPFADAPSAEDLPVGRPALAASSDYPLRLPPSPRRIEGAFDVETSAWRLAVAYACHRALMRGIAGKLIGVAAFEAKIELAHQLYHHAEAAGRLRNRAIELRCSTARLDTLVSTTARAIASDIAEARDTVALIVVLEGWTAAFLAIHRDYRARTSGLLDQPSVRTLGPIIADLDAATLWLGEARTAYARAGIEADVPESRPRYAALLEDELERADRCAAIDMPAEPARRARACRRDDRLPTFHHTRRYDSVDLPPSDRDLDETQCAIVEALRIQRDELDAIETFANILFDDSTHPFAFELRLARLIWDEARHAEAGQVALGRMGYDPFAVPCGIIGINVRTDLPPLLALAQISSFGELNQLGRLRSLSRAADRHGDPETARLFDYIHADELQHVRHGRAWLKHLAGANGTSLAQLESAARAATVQALRDAGLDGEDDLETLSDRDLAMLLGE